MSLKQNDKFSEHQYENRPMTLDEILKELLKRGCDKDAPFDGVYYQDTKQKIKHWALENKLKGAY